MTLEIVVKEYDIWVEMTLVPRAGVSDDGDITKNAIEKIFFWIFIVCSSYFRWWLILSLIREFSWIETVIWLLIFSAFSNISSTVTKLCIKLALCIMNWCIIYFYYSLFIISHHENFKALNDDIKNTDKVPKHFWSVKMNINFLKHIYCEICHAYVAIINLNFSRITVLKHWRNEIDSNLSALCGCWKGK